MSAAEIWRSFLFCFVAGTTLVYFFSVHVFVFVVPSNFSFYSSSFSSPYSVPYLFSFRSMIYY